MKRCRIFCGYNLRRYFIEAVMYLSDDNIIIALDFTHVKQQGCMTSRIDYGFIVIHKDIVDVLNIIDAFNEADHDYNNNQLIEIYNYEMKFHSYKNGSQLYLHDIKHNCEPLIFDIIKCDKQKYNEHFIECLKQTI
jgi:hypothetical protein